jgi:hypothetical protein
MKRVMLFASKVVAAKLSQLTDAVRDYRRGAKHRKN